MRKGIAKLSAFEAAPDSLSYGFLCAMLATGIWLLLATYWELPVSTTHSIVGAIIGMTMVSAGPDAVIWSSKKDDFRTSGAWPRCACPGCSAPSWAPRWPPSCSSCCAP
ncbi:hypothetical protein ABPG75_008983 [Micractinium tetrahymenae]